MERALTQAISAYMIEVYPYEQERPKVAVFDTKQFQEKTGSRYFSGTYLIQEDLIAFRYEGRGTPLPSTVAHEIEHWQQARRVGLGRYLEQLQDIKTYLAYERSANEVSLHNAPRLKWWEWTYAAPCPACGET